MRPGNQHSRGWQHDASEGEGQQQPQREPSRSAEVPPPGCGAEGGTQYRVVYSSDDSYSDGELHVERRAGSISAWYQAGRSAGSPSQHRSLAGADVERQGSGTEPLRSSVTVVLHDRPPDLHATTDGSKGGDSSRRSEDGNGSSGGGGSGCGRRAAGGSQGASLAVSRAELEDMITWETNNLFDYLRGLYQQGAEGAGQEPGSPQLDRWEPECTSCMACAFPGMQFDNNNTPKQHKTLLNWFSLLFC